MNSMTGYGRGEAAQDGFKLTVEISSVNRRQSEIAVSLPRDLEVLEARIRDVINQCVSRGRVTVRVSLHATSGATVAGPRLNVRLARAFARDLNRLAKELRLPGGVTLDLVVRAPGVMEASDDVADAEGFWPAVETALRRGLAQLTRMRQREGRYLSRDLAARVAVMRRAAARVRKQAPQVAIRYREQLRERIASAGLELPGVDDERLSKEVVYFADRADITEELTRLESHFRQFEDCVKSTEPVGRTLDFLAQEMNREVNTIGSKANDSQISRDVVTLKAELERFREQAQNVE
jgi:uncharacterized protein (TIGR00255 family)